MNNKYWKFLAIAFLSASLAEFLFVFFDAGINFFITVDPLFYIFVALINMHLSINSLMWKMHKDKSF